jgi:DNA-binding MarR family transcriptional regulator
MVFPQSVAPLPFDVDASIGYLLYRAHQRAVAEFRRRLEPVGLTPQQFGLLAFLHEQDGQRQAALCERGATDPNTMVGLVDRLESVGLVARGRDPRDRRVHLVRLTDRGRRVFRRCVPLQRQASRRCFGTLSATEQSRLRRLLRKLLNTHPSPGNREVRHER